MSASEARGAGEGGEMTRTQLSLELDEGRAAALLGLPITANPYRKPEAQVLPRWDELARNWESGWTLGKSAKVAEHSHSGNCWDDVPVRDGHIVDFCEKHDEPRGSCSVCPKCPTCGEEAPNG